MTGEKQNWIVNAWHPAGLAVGDRVEARSRQGDPWDGTFIGVIISITMNETETYACVQDPYMPETAWDIDIGQLRVLQGERCLEVWLCAAEELLIRHGAYRVLKLDLFQFNMGWLEVRLECKDTPRKSGNQAGTRSIIGRRLVRVFEDEVLEVLVTSEITGKPTRAEIELVHPNKERWTWEHEFPVRLGLDGLMYCCLGAPDDLPDIDDMTDLPDDETVH